MTHYAISGGSTFWVADGRLTCYAVDADEHRIVPQARPALGMRLVQAPVIDGGTMFQVLRQPGMPGVTVSAFDLKRNEAVWQTWVAAPLAAEPTLAPVSGKLTVATASGGMFRAPLDGLKPQGKAWEPILTIDSSRLTKPLCSLLPLPGEMFAMTSGAETTQIVIYDPKEQDKQFRWMLSPREMSVAPGLFAGGLLTACVNGQVFLLDPEARGDMAKPLEPAVKGGNDLGVADPGGRRRQAGRVVRRRQAVDGDPHQQRWGEGPHRSRGGQNEKQPGLAGRRLGQAGFRRRARRGRFDRHAVEFRIAEARTGQVAGPGARCVWGPQRVGKLVLVATEKDRLFAIDEQQQVVWQSALNYGPLAGAPYLSGDEIFLSARSGTVWRISAADGKELGKVDAGCPLGTGPLVVGPRVIVGGHEGSLLEVKKP